MITDSRTTARAVVLMEELTGYHFRPRAAEATLPRLSKMGIVARSQPKGGRGPLLNRRWGCPEFVDTRVR